MPVLSLSEIQKEDYWSRVAQRAVQSDWSAIDTEYWEVDGSGHWAPEYDVRRYSPLGRTRVFLWSVAIPTGAVTARGTGVSGVVLPAEALGFPAIRSWLCSTRPKYAHNAAAEHHALLNHGIQVGGLQNTLSLARWYLPGRTAYSLDSLGEEILGEGKTEDFRSLFHEEGTRMESKWKSRDIRYCVCGSNKCRKRTLPDHAKNEFVEEYEVVNERPFNEMRTPDWVMANRCTPTPYRTPWCAPNWPPTCLVCPGPGAGPT